MHSLRAESLICLAVVALVVTGSPASPQRLQVMERWSTGSAARQVEFGSIGGMTEHLDGRIWISDPINRVVVALTADGARPERVALPGRGPGEVEGPDLLATHPRIGTGVYDVAQRIVHLFGSDGRFSRGIFIRNVIYFPKGFAFLPTGEFVISGGIEGNPGTVHLHDANGALVRSWHPGPSTENPRARLMVGGGAVSITREGRILFSQAAPHEVVLYATTGRRIRRLASETGLLRSIGDDFISERGHRRTFDWNFSRSVAVFEMPGGLILNVVWNNDENWSLWQVYERGGRRIHQIRVRRAYRPWALASNGDVLASYAHAETDEQIAVRLVLAWDGEVPPLR
jgi:hypothetical protein